MSWAACLENLTSLNLLQLRFCHNIKCILLNSIGSNTLKCLVVLVCRELSSIGGLHALASIQHVQISDCPKKKELRAEEEELLKFLS
nr:unnamed protein product [Digitaria exilis]